MAGPYNMSGMASALPQGSYRQYAPGQQRFSNATSSPTLSGPGSMPSFGTQADMTAISQQQYYMPQHAQISQYYSSALASAQQNTATSRSGSTFYPTSMSMGQQAHPSAQFYYSQVTPYATQGQSVSSQIVPAQYMSSANPTLDPRLSHAHLDGQSSSSLFSSEHGTGEKMKLVHQHTRKNNIDIVSVSRFSAKYCSRASTQAEAKR